MAKRFTDNQKWQDDWFFNLEPSQKLCWIYLLDNCDHAGIWKKNIRLLNFHVGSNFFEDEIKAFLDGKVFEFDNKWFIPKFITFQYGSKFNTSGNKAVQSAIAQLSKYFILEETNGTLTPIQLIPNSMNTLSIPLTYPIDTLSVPLASSPVRVKDKEKEKEQEERIEQLKIKTQLKLKLQEQFNKTIPNVIEYIDKNNLDKVERIDKFNFEKNYQDIIQYQKIKI